MRTTIRSLPIWSRLSVPPVRPCCYLSSSSQKHLLLFSTKGESKNQPPPKEVEVKDTGSRRLSTVDPQIKGAFVLYQDRKFDKMKKYLDDHNISPDAHAAKEDTLLAYAARSNDVIGMKFLIDKCGTSLSSTCDCPRHRTALHYAVLSGAMEAVEFLLNRGAQVRMKDSGGESALDYSNSILKQHKQAIHHAEQWWRPMMLCSKPLEPALLVRALTINDLVTAAAANNSTIDIAPFPNTIAASSRSSLR